MVRILVVEAMNLISVRYNSMKGIKVQNMKSLTQNDKQQTWDIENHKSRLSILGSCRNSNGIRRAEMNVSKQNKG